MIKNVGLTVCDRFQLSKTSISACCTYLAIIYKFCLCHVVYHNRDWKLQTQMYCWGGKFIGM